MTNLEFMELAYTTWRDCSNEDRQIFLDKFPAEFAKAMNEQFICRYILENEKFADAIKDELCGMVYDRLRV